MKILYIYTCNECTINFVTKIINPTRIDDCLKRETTGKKIRFIVFSL